MTCGMNIYVVSLHTLLLLYHIILLYFIKSCAILQCRLHEASHQLGIYYLPVASILCSWLCMVFFNVKNGIQRLVECTICYSYFCMTCSLWNISNVTENIRYLYIRGKEKILSFDSFSVYSDCCKKIHDCKFFSIKSAVC